MLSRNVLSWIIHHVQYSQLKDEYCNILDLQKVTNSFQSNETDINLLQMELGLPTEVTKEIYYVVDITKVETPIWG
jgi:hypothetical protein